MKRRTLAVGMAGVLVAAGAVGGAWTMWGHDDVTVEAVCALDTSRREYVTHHAVWVVVAKVAERGRYLDQTPGDSGGVLLSTLTVEDRLKGDGAAVPATFAVGQPIGVNADGAYYSGPAAEHQAVLVPGRRYVIAGSLAPEYGGGYVIAADPADDTRATPDAWTRAVAEATPQPPCEDIVTDAPTG
ncbi:hypothetical protein ACFXPI_21355 [Streptomyces sp. NPDC059104]|uniref:hypothetical protein n=1 Tax=Streptomyces sp. NPDC059104 TaxID=3346729 RepID=UPI0036A3E92C